MYFPSVALRCVSAQEDIPLLVQHFLQKFEGKMGKTIEMVAARVMKELVAYDWPGNIRELENLIEER